MKTKLEIDGESDSIRQSSSQLSISTSTPTSTSESRFTPTTSAPIAPLQDVAGTDNDPIPVSGPYRRSFSKATKGILKPSTLPSPRFSFRRDLLSYVGDSLSPITGAVLTSAPSFISNSNHQLESIPSSSSPLVTTISQRNQGQQPLDSVNNTLDHDAAPPMSSGRSAFWKRLGGAVTAVAATVPVPQAAARTIQNLASGSSAASTSSILRDHLSGSSSSIAASVGTSDSLSNPPHSPHIAASHVSSTSDLSFDSIKSVRFTMSSLTVVYPLNTANAPGTEALTRQRINKEYRLRSTERRDRGWTGEELRRLYDDCCRTREEPGIPSLRKLLMVSRFSLHSSSQGHLAMEETCLYQLCQSKFIFVYSGFIRAAQSDRSEEPAADEGSNRNSRRPFKC